MIALVPPKSGRIRAVIDRVIPEVDGGRFPIKRCVGEAVDVEAHILIDGHEQLSCLLLHRAAGEDAWHEVPLALLNNDRWLGRFELAAPGRHQYTVIAWVDHFLTWRHDLARREDAADIAVAMQVGELLLNAAAFRANRSDAKRLKDCATKLLTGPPEAGRDLAQSDELSKLMARNAERAFVAEYERTLEVVVDVERARFSSWYELFPRSCGSDGKTHGNFVDVMAQLPDIAAMGFDVLYLPPIHPVGRAFRKGPNNSLEAGPDDPGSPWAIGGAEGGHRDIHPRLGSREEFRELVRRANATGIAIAMDIAFQCAPDHPYVTQHPQWFRHRPDGGIQYAENPPKKYQDIYPFDFETEDWQALWLELKGVVEHWIGEGVRIFRVDNPHTKPFAFWEWLIGGVKADHPDVIFLAEAFTRPKIMHRLAKLGFTQSYTYFTWRNTKDELSEYFTELAQHESREYFRPNLWPNTPDILHEFLQHGGRPAFKLRVALAATLGASYGIYGPAYELMEHLALKPGTEDYVDSEKYQLRRWDLDRPDSLRPFIARLNRIRHEHRALQSDWSLRFHPVDNPLMLCYSKTAGDETLVMVASLDPLYIQSGWIELPLHEFGLAYDAAYPVHDLLSGVGFTWQGHRIFVRLDPQAFPMHILLLRRA